MKTYKWIDQGNGVVAVIDEDGVCRSSGLASVLVPDGVTPAPADPIDFRPAMLAAVRAAREVALNRLAGIALFDSTKQQACADARAALLRITDPIKTATDEESAKAAVVAQYAAIVTAAGADLVLAFAEF